jgi:AcrR family transcriptional regulator
MPKIVDHDAYRRELLSKCFELFFQKGYSGVNMREIAKELRVSTGTLYYYFPNKKSLLDNMVIMINQREGSELKLRLKRSNNLKQRLTLLKDYVKENEEEFQKIILLAVDYFHNRNSDKDMEIFRSFVEYSSSIISKNIGLGKDISLVVLIFFSGLVFYRLLCPDVACYEKQGNLFMRLLDKYISDKKGKIAK